jgi:hypothetical protein
VIHPPPLQSSFYMAYEFKTLKTQKTTGFQFWSEADFKKLLQNNGVWQQNLKLHFLLWEKKSKFNSPKNKIISWIKIWALVYFSGPWENSPTLWQYLVLNFFLISIRSKITSPSTNLSMIPFPNPAGGPLLGPNRVRRCIFSWCQMCILKVTRIW